MNDGKVIKFPSLVPEEGEPAAEDKHVEMQAAAQLKNDQALINGLVAIRKKRKLSQKDVAELMKLSVEEVAKFEHPTSDPSLSVIRRYAGAVGASVNHLATYLC